MARPARPATESRAVRDAAAMVRTETGLTAADPVASIIAARVVVALNEYLAEGVDPLLAAVGELRRRTCQTPYDTLAIDPDIDSLALFVEARVGRLRSRCGRSLSSHEDEVECRDVWAFVRERLADRYIRALRKKRAAHQPPSLPDQSVPINQSVRA
jgi:hypothetical protein